MQRHAGYMLLYAYHRGQPYVVTETPRWEGWSCRHTFIGMLKGIGHILEHVLKPSLQPRRVGCCLANCDQLLVLADVVHILLTNVQQHIFPWLPRNCAVLQRTIMSSGPRILCCWGVLTILQHHSCNFSVITQWAISVLHNCRE